MTRTKWALALASTAAAGMAGVFGLTGCSSSSSNGGGSGVDAGSDATVYDGAVGVGMADCTPAVCPAPAICGGTLLGPDTPVSYCTVSCKADSDCPAGSACDTKVTSMHCLKKCSSDSDCSGGFACHLDAGTSGYLCWSPYSGADPGPDAGGVQVDAAADAGPADAAGNDAALDGGNDAAPPGDGASASDASDAAPGDATPDAVSDAPAG